MKTIFLIIIVLVLEFPLSFGLEFHEGQVMWDDANFHTNPTIIAKKIQVTDPDMNQNPTEAEKFHVSIHSDSDPDGIVVLVHETGKNTGVFQSIIYFSESVSNGQRIHTNLGDTVTAEYLDKTLPNFLDADESLISDTVTIDSFGNSYDSNIRVHDPSFFKQNLLTGETIPNVFLVQMIQSLGASLIIAFIIIYAIKKRRKK